MDEKSIAWKVAEFAYNEGAEIVLTNAPIALRMGTINNLAEKTSSIVIPADATSMDDLTNLYNKSMDHFGSKIDFVLHSIGMSVNVRKGKEYYDMNYDWTQKGMDVSSGLTGLEEIPDIKKLELILFLNHQRLLLLEVE